MARKPKKPIEVKTLVHDEAKRRNIPTAEFQSVMRDEEKSPIRLAIERRNRDLDPQLVWRGKDERDWSDLVVQAPPLYIQEKVHPKVLIDDLARESRARRNETAPETPDLFADFNGLPDAEAATEFYRHDANWSNRMILGDSLQVMASLAEREGLRGKVQCIYLDPPYGIKFNSNFQWSTTSRDVKDGKADHITREPEQVKAFRDTWRDGIHSYLTYLRDRLTVARDLLADSGSIFVQIGDENVHRVRALMDEVFGEENFVSEIKFLKTTGKSPGFLDSNFDTLIWFGKSAEKMKFRRTLSERSPEDDYNLRFVQEANGQRHRIKESEVKELWEQQADFFRPNPLTSQTPSATIQYNVDFQGRSYSPGKRGWSTNEFGMTRLKKAGRLMGIGNTLTYLRFLRDAPTRPHTSFWDDTRQSGFGDEKLYVVQTAPKVVERCILMATDPGDLVLDPTCGSGTTATVAEQWGRRWITIDTSRVALALARARIMGARYPYYLLADSGEGQRKEAEVTGKPPSEAPTRGDIRQGFVYRRVPHITLKAIANNAEIDVIWEKWQATLEPLRAALNAALGRAPSSLRATDGSAAIQPGSPRRAAPRDDAGEGAPRDDERGDAALGRTASSLRATDGSAAIQSGSPRRSAPRDDETGDAPRDDETGAAPWEEWEIPRQAGDGWPAETRDLHARWWEARINRQREIDDSIARNADYEYLYDKPYADKSRVRVAGPFTVESLSPHRVLAVDENDELFDELAAAKGGRAAPDHGTEANDFARVMLDHLRTAGVQQAHKADRITFTSIDGWPGRFICAEGRYVIGGGGATGAGDDATEPGIEKRAGILIGPEFGTVSRPDLVAAAKEAGDASFDVLIACAFNYDAHAADFDRLGRVPVLKARMNPDLHMADDLKNTGQGNLFVVFGEPDIEIEEVDDGDDAGRIRVRIKGVDVFHPQTGEITSSGADGIACWFIDTDYNEESFFVRQAYFLGAGDPYKALKTTLKAEIDREAWETLHSDTSRPFDKPTSGRIAVKVINHLGDEVMKVFGVQ